MTPAGPASGSKAASTPAFVIFALCAASPLSAQCREGATAFDRGCRALEITAMYHVEAWDENESRDEVAGAAVAFSWAIRDGWTLVGEGVGYRVAQIDSPAHLGGGSAMIRRRLYERGGLALFADAGLGLSYADAPVPARGTRFNYLLQAGAGLTRRLTRRFDLIGHIRHLHVSNNGLAGSSRNPDIQTLGVQVGLAWRL